ncbi:organic hydroperoxide resistance protein [Vitreimonas sp.]|jgi:osmotically inducible protein OsmC|uniref:organic hydroperoxide resistance protein n=1 Tax=Vitreimonas sp. TaxID=3069702 RepID=UPI002C283388|nr:organic hydroperoxide resistance protein [Verrucomicrobiae bacterium]
MADALFTTTAISKGGRAGGKIALAEGGLWIHTEHSKGLGGSGEGTNPEQLFALGWSNCFNSAVLFVATQKKIDASKAVVKCEVGIGREEGGLGLSAKLTLAIPGMDRAQVQELIEAAHQVCPYSKATRNNIPVELIVEG